MRTWHIVNAQDRNILAIKSRERISDVIIVRFPKRNGCKAASATTNMTKKEAPIAI